MGRKNLGKILRNLHRNSVVEYIKIKAREQPRELY